MISASDIHAYAKANISLPSGDHFWGYLNTHAGRFARLINDINSIGSQIDSILDVGSGSYMETILRGFCKFSIYDSPQGVDLEIDDWAAPYAGKYDLVICTEVIEHMAADSAYLVHQCARSLKSGGYLYLTTVNIARFLSLYSLAHGETPYSMGGLFGRRTDRHQREYAPRETADLVAAQGFEVRFTTADCYEVPAFLAQREAWAKSNIPELDPRLHRDTNVIIGRKIEDIPSPVRTWPVFHHSVSANKAWAEPVTKERVTLTDDLFS
jgi:SAM-dependent methyltransferase